MDGGTALAAVQLAASVWTGCLGGYRLITTAQNIGKDSQALLWKFRIQETRLRMWGIEWGLSDQFPTSRDGSGRGVADNHQVLESLLRISDLLKDYKELSNRYGLTLVAEEYAPIATQRHGSLEAFIQAEFEQYHMLDAEIMQRRSRAAGFLKKFRWAVTDKSKFSQIVLDLKDFNDGLYHLLSYAERRALQQGLGIELQSSENVVELEVIEQAAAGCENVPQIASLKRKSIPIQHQDLLLLPRPTAFVPTEELQIPMDQITLQSSEGDTQIQEQRCIATYRPRTGPAALQATRVIVEFKTFEKETSSSIQFTQLSRIDNLARLLHISSKPPSLCVPQCLGYVRQEWPARIGYVFQLAGGEQSDAGPPPPSPASAIQLASLHDLLGSNEVPYLGDRFCQAYDIYALGIVLLEIGLWRPITELWRPSYTSAEIFQRKLREHYLPRLGGRVGKVYMDIVGRCLSGDLVEDDGEEGDGRRAAPRTEREENPFYWNVVRELARLVA